MIIRSYLLMLAVLLVLPAGVFAIGEHGMDHAKKGVDQVGMSPEGTMYLLGVHEVDGVKCLAHINDVRAQMAEHGMKQTHHIMVAFEGVVSGDAIESGTVAVKIEDPDGNIGDAVKLTGMEGHFGVDITLDKIGMYHFKIGAKLADGKKRTFHHHFENK